MKTVVVIVRVILGLIFLLFGLNGFLHFLHMRMPDGDALTYFGILMSSHILAVICVLQVICGLLLLVGRYVPLALTVLSAIIFNILLYHLLLWPAGRKPAALVTILTAYLLWSYRGSFAGIFSCSAQPTA